MRILGLALLLAAAAAAAGQTTIYQWTDDRGVVHFSDRGVPGRYAADAQTRELAAPVPRPEAPPARIPLTLRNGKRFVNATLEGRYATRDVLMLVDTGAQITMIDEDLAEQLQVEFVEETGIVGVTGVAPGWIGRLHRIKLGDREVTDWRVMVGPLPGVYLLGADVLDRLELTIGTDALRRDG